MADKAKPKKKFFKKKPAASSAANEDGASESTSNIDDSILQYESGDPTAIKRWQDHWGLRADTLYPGLSSIFILDSLPKIQDVEVPTVVWDDSNDPHKIHRMSIAEDIKRYGRDQAELKKGSFTLFAELLRSISPAGVQAIKTYIHAEKVNDYEDVKERFLRQKEKAINILSHRNDIRDRRKRRQQRQAKTLLKLQALEEQNKATSAEAVPTSAPPTTKSRSRASSEAASTTATSAEAVSTSTAPPTIKFIAPDDSDTDEEPIPDNDDDLEKYFNDFPDIPDPEDAWNEFRASCSALELHRAVKMTHVVRRSGNEVTDFNQASQKYWQLKMRPHQTLDRYHQIWTETVQGFIASSGGNRPATERQMAQRFIESLDPGRWGEMQAQCINNSQSWDAAIKANAYPATVNQAFVNASKRVTASAQSSAEGRKPPLAMSVIAKIPTKKVRTLAVETKPDSKDKDKEVRGEDKKEEKDKKSKPCTRPCNLCSEMHWTSDCPHLDACRSQIRSKTAKTVKTNVVSLHTTAISLAVTPNTKSNPINDNMVIDDNASDIHIFRNRNLLTNIRPAEEHLLLTGINSEAEAILCTETGEFGEIKPVYVCDQSAGNILSHTLLEDEYPMSVVQGDHISFKLENSTIRFNRVGRRYVWTNETSTMTTSVRENEKGFSKRELERAEKARDLTEKLNHPGESTIEQGLKHGIWDNVEFTAHDLHRAQQIKGPDVPGLKGRSTRPRPSEMDFRGEKLEVQRIRFGTLSIDIMSVEKSLFIVGIIDQIGMTFGQYIRNKSASTLLDALTMMSEQCEKHGWNVTIRSDNEKSIVNIVNHLRTKQVRDIDLVAPGTHVPIIERKIRTLQEKTRAVLSRLPYTAPAFLIKWLVNNVIVTDNMMPTNSGNKPVDEHRCPREIFFGRRVDVKKDLKVAFGQYVQLYNTNNQFVNSMNPRTRGAIALGTIPGTNGTTRFWVLSTNRIVTASKWTEIPIDDNIISSINNYGVKQGASQTDPPDENEADRVIKDGDEDDSQQTKPEVAATAEPESEVDVTLEPEPVVDAVEQSETEVPDENVVVAAPPTKVDDVVGAGDVNDIASELILRRSQRPNLGKPKEKYTYKTNASRVTKSRIQNRHVHTFNTSAKKAIKEHGKPVVDAIIAEITSILSYDSLRAINPRLLNRKETKRIMRSKLFLKMKTHPDGSFDKWKARLVAGGDSQDRSEYTLEETSSPTVALWAVFCIAAMRKKGSVVRTMDIKSAYLNAIVNSRELLMRVQPDVAAIMTTLVPEWQSELDEDGSLVVRLHKALYGCVESAKLFYEHLRNSLEEIGYRPLQSDPCVYLKKDYNTGKHNIIMTHVDDLHCIFVSEENANEVEEHLERTYGKINLQKGDDHNFIGMQLSYKDNDTVKVSMDGYVREILCQYGISQSDIARYPANGNLFVTSETSPILSESEQNSFRSRVMKIMYLAIRIRPDLLTALSYLTTRLTKATEEDREKLHQVYCYINHTANLFLTLSADDPLIIKAWVDASHGIHHDYRGHTGGTQSLGKGSIHSKSTRQKRNSKSSTESEIYGVTDYLSNIFQVQEFLRELGLVEGPARLFQDNQSTMKLFEKGRPASDATRHIAMRYFFAKDRVDQGDLQFVYCPTEDMTADALTKPLTGKAFFKHRHALLNLPGTTDRRGVLELPQE